MAALIDSIKRDNDYAMVPEATYESIVKPIYEKLYNTKYSNVEFDPEKHLNYYAGDLMSKHKFNNTRRLTMEELGLTNKHQISHIGVTDPFPLFTEEAIYIMKQEILSKEIFLKYARFSNSSSTGRDCSIRGYCKNGEGIQTPFTYAAWTHPKTMELVSLMAGVELEVVFDFEIAHVNVSMKDPAKVEAELKQYEQTKQRNLADDCVVSWHHDSYPFVCVLMLSDTTNMIGGETSLRMGTKSEGAADSDNIALVPSPTMGSAAMLQGRFIEHIAPNPIGMSERITMVTSFRAKDPTKFDKSVLATVKPEINSGSKYNDFYPQWIDYRCGLLIDNLKRVQEKVTKQHQALEPFNKKEAMDSLKNIQEYLLNTYKEMEITEAEWTKATSKYNQYLANNQ